MRHLLTALLLAACESSSPTVSVKDACPLIRDAACVKWSECGRPVEVCEGVSTDACMTDIKGEVDVDALDTCLTDLAQRTCNQLAMLPDSCLAIEWGK